MTIGRGKPPHPAACRYSKPACQQIHAAPVMPNGDKDMARLDRRIETALLSLNPTTKRPSWHAAPTFMGVLRGVTPTMALWRPARKAPHICIWATAVHVAFWQNSVGNRLSSETIKFAPRVTPQRWPPAVDTLSADQWKETVALVARTHRRLVSVVADFDPAALDRPPRGTTNRRAIEYIHGIAEHNLYHGGQINILKRLAKMAGVK